MAHTKIKISESFQTASILAVVGGMLDIYTYLLKGQVFATAETGNLILLGIYVTQGEWKISLSYLFPILFFTFGVMTAESIRKFFQKNKFLHWRQIIILVEMIILFSIAFVEGEEFNIITNSIISFISSIQIQSFKKVHGNPFTSTMCTGNLRSGTESLYFYLETKEKSFLTKALHYYSIILFFVSGAVLGACCIKLLGTKALLVTIFLLIIVFIKLFRE